MGSTAPQSQNPNPPHVYTGAAGVVGAGIAGLCAAIGLRRAGWEVEVFEKSRFKNEIGAAITVPSNATLVLKRWGFDLEKAGAVPNDKLTIARAADLEVFYREEFAEMASEFGHGIWTIHRVDLHRGLREIATAIRRESADGEEEGRFGPPVEIRLGCEVVGVDCERGILRLPDGQTVEKDLVIIADGAHSALLSDFTGHPSVDQRTGRSVYRWLVSMDDVMADPVLRAQYEGELPGYTAYSSPDMKLLWVTYTCRGGKVLNNALVHTTQTGEGEPGEENQWHAPVSRDQVLSRMEGFHPSLKKIVAMASEDGIKVHNLFKRPALTSFVRGVTAVVGDAAHVMLPTHGAGGGIAIESAASLEVLFSRVDGRNGAMVQQRLAVFDKLRIPRCNLTMLASNGGPEWRQLPGVVEEIRRFYSGPLPPAGLLQYNKPFREIFFCHDEFRAAEQALAQLNQAPSSSGLASAEAEHDSPGAAPTP